MRTQIKAEIVAHSINEQGDELISVLATFPRIILAEVNTHRMLSKNTSSSRAIPFNKMVEAIQNDPFIPIAWQKEHKGMQGNEYLTGRAADLRNQQWLIARDNAVEMATALSLPLNDFGGDLVSEPATKQLANRLLEPFMWTTMLITGPKSGWDNFFNLRCPSYDGFKSKKDFLEENPELIQVANKDNKYWLQLNKGQAEIHIMKLAECIWDAYNESTPSQLKAGEWHIPFESVVVKDEIRDTTRFDHLSSEEIVNRRVKISVAMAARTSYTVVGEEKALDFEAMIGLHDRLLAWDPPHSSPLEHCAQAMTNEEYWSSFGTTAQNTKGNGWCNNFKGFIPYRYMVDNGKVD